jgi:signal transduction histidine kinase
VDACLFDRSKQDHRVEFTVEKIEGNGISFTVSDDGIGMDAETKNKMFTLFFSSKGSQGTGLGLFIAHRVIKYHGGRVEVESQPGKGSRFTILIPFKKTKNSSIITDRNKGDD